MRGPRSESVRSRRPWRRRHQIRHAHHARAYYGTTRFDDFARRVGITKAATSARLAELVDLGLLARRPYQEPGQRSRDEYVLTEAGIEFMPVVWAMFQWGQRHLPGRRPLRLTHAGCGADARVEFRCTQGHHVPPEELIVRAAREPDALGLLVAEDTCAPTSSAPAPATPR